MTIVAAVDRDERAAAVIREGEALAEAFDEPLHVVHVLGQSEFIDLERVGYDDTSEVRDMREISEVAEEFAVDAAGDVDVDHEVVGLVGKAQRRIVEYADEVDARYLVLGPRKRSPSGKALFGSVAQSVILNADCPVITTVEN